MFIFGLVVVIIPLQNPSHSSKRSIQQFAQYLSELGSEISDDPTDIQLSNREREFFNVKGNATALGSNIYLMSRLSRCKKAGYWAYILTCTPRKQCGGEREIKFLYYVSGYCNGVFPDSLSKKLDVNEVFARCEDLRLDQKQSGTSRRRNKELMLIAVEGSSEGSLEALRNLQSDNTELLKACRKHGRTRCNKACQNSYRILCYKHYTCPDDVIADFAVNCYIACGYYFGGS